MHHFIALLALLAVIPYSAFAAGAPATGCTTTAPEGQGYERNLPCCTHPDYDPATDGERCLAPVSRFDLVLKQFGFLRDDGAQFYYGSQQTIDLASVGAGEAFGNFVAAADLPAGRYVGIIPVAGRTVRTVVNVTIAGGRRCTLDTNYLMMDDSLPTCGAGEPNRSVTECLDADGDFGRFVDDHPMDVAYDPARGMTVRFGFWLDNGAVCDFSGSGDVTADFFDMPVLARVTAN